MYSRDDLLDGGDGEEELIEVECPTCGGTGMLAGGEGDDMWEEECRNCDGTGLVEE